MAMAMASLLVAATGYTVMAAAPVVLYAAPAVHAKVAQQLGNSIVVHRSRLPLHFVPTDVEHADPEPAATPDVTQQQLGIRQSAQARPSNAASSLLLLPMAAIASAVAWFYAVHRRAEWALLALTAGRKIDVAKVQQKVEGEPDTPEFSIYLTESDEVISPWHDIPLQGPAGVFNFVNEIPRGTKAKMEVCLGLEENPIKQDRKKDKLRYFTYEMGFGGIPFNYGLIPQTFEDPNEPHPDTGCVGDADPIDLVEISPNRLPMGSVHQVKVLGCLAMIDEGETDWKIIAIDVNDPRASSLETVEDLAATEEGKTQLDQIRQWFQMYKTTDGKPENSFAFDGQYKGKEYALQIIDEVHVSWKDLLRKKIDNNGLAMPPSQAQHSTESNEFIFKFDNQSS
jgi:inorganic pyrophosphatase